MAIIPEFRYCDTDKLAIVAIRKTLETMLAEMDTWQESEDRFREETAIRYVHDQIRRLHPGFRMHKAYANKKQNGKVLCFDCVALEKLFSGKTISVDVQDFPESSDQSFRWGWKLADNHISFTFLLEAVIDRLKLVGTIEHSLSGDARRPVMSFAFSCLDKTMTPVLKLAEYGAKY